MGFPRAFGLLLVLIGAGLVGCERQSAEEQQKSAAYENLTPVPPPVSPLPLPAEAPKQTPEPAPSAPPTVTEMTAETTAPKPATEAVTPSAIAPEAVISAFRDINYVWSKKPSAEEKTTWEEKWNKILSKYDGVTKMSDEADLIASEFKKEQDGKTFLYLLFRINKAFDKDRGLHIRGIVDVTHQQHLRPEDQAKGYADWGYIPDPPTTKWHDLGIDIGGNSYILIRRGAVTAEIPYNIKLSFFTNDEGKTKYNPYGETVDLGWRVAE